MSSALFLLLLFSVPYGSSSQTQTPNDQSWNRRIAGTGDYQIVLEVSGRIETTRALKMPNAMDLAAICAAKQAAETDAFQSAESYLQSLEKALDKRRYLAEIVRLHNELGQLYSYRGNMNKAITHFEAAYQSLQQVLREQPEYSEDKIYLEEILGISYLRRGELDNCVNNHNAEMCLFPLSSAGQHKLKEGASGAIEYFQKHLAQKPDNLEVRWLLNLAAMTLGQYPRSIKREWLIPMPITPVADRLPKFPDIASGLHVDPVRGAGGSILDDFDNDGNLDIVISSVDACEPLQYFHNNGDGTFADWTAKANLSNQLGGINCVQTDYNNDGWLDIFVMRGGWEFAMRNSLLKNNGDGTFTDVTEASGLLSDKHRTHSAAWADFDNDGWLDVFIGHEETPSQLFRNNGNGTFTNVSDKAGVNRREFTKGATWGDYDNDGNADLYVSNYGSENFLYHNDGNGHFSEIAKTLGVNLPIMSFPTWFFDYDNDGWLDLFVASFVPSVTEVARGYLGLPPQAETMKLYRNNQKGGFEDVTSKVGLNRVVPTMGANFGDLDNDGFTDFYLGTGAPSYTALMPNFMFRNRDGKRFADVTASTATGHLQKGHGVAFGDVDNDGDQDLYVNVGGFIPGDKYNKALFANPNQKNGNHWLSLRLVGEKTNRAAIGTKIKLTLIMPNGTKATRYKEVSSGGSFGDSSLTQHIGLGKATKVDSLEVRWPVSNQVQTFRNVAINQSLEIKESAANYQVRKIHSLTFKLDSVPAKLHSH
ncbi:MAG: VCBS repeat-containing protein [Acidobacteria bacterium]|nr:VCBS repeat-containing protein [Acidobacteriota bacterium]